MSVRECLSLNVRIVPLLKRLDSPDYGSMRSQSLDTAPTKLTICYRRHAFYDLRPYICTFKECELKMFSSRTAWFDHEHRLHRVQWPCPFCSNTPSPSWPSFVGHIQRYHARSFTEDKRDALP